MRAFVQDVLLAMTRPDDRDTNPALCAPPRRSRLRLRLLRAGFCEEGQIR